MLRRALEWTILSSAIEIVAIIRWPG
jgi:hypothetical protein